MQAAQLREAVVGWVPHDLPCFLTLSWVGFKAGKEEFWGMRKTDKRGKDTFQNSGHFISTVICIKTHRFLT
jgi:hypothetical protein